MPTGIEWAEEVWNPVTGCTPVSEGCENCYARRMAQRLKGRYGYPADDPFQLVFHPNRLDQPRRWQKPRRIFVSSMGDLFHEDVPGWIIGKVFKMAALCPRHTFLFLTKRPVAMAEILSPGPSALQADWHHIWPLPNVWLGVTAENQARAEERIPILMQIPAAVRFVSYEPGLGPVDLQPWLNPQHTAYYDMEVSQTPILSAPRLDWVICGGESGPGARPMNPDWPRRLRDQCVSAGLPFLFKQWGAWAHEKTGRFKIFRARDGAYTIVQIKGQGLGPIPIDTALHKWPDGSWSACVGKKAAGRLLDGRVWDEYPEVGGQKPVVSGGGPAEVPPE